MAGFAMVAMTLVVAGCHRGTHPTYERTHVKDSITVAHANMFQTYGAKERLGTISFHETDAGLGLEIDLMHLRPGKTYRMYVHNGTTNARHDVKLPTIVGPTGRHVDNTYVAHGVSAHQLTGHQLVLERDGQIVGAGIVGAGALQ
jgi:hypothetical protein